MREFAEGEIAPGAAERDEHGRFPSELIPKLAEQGLLGIMVPEEYGGAGYDALSAAHHPGRGRAGRCGRCAAGRLAQFALLGAHPAAGQRRSETHLSPSTRARRKTWRVGAHRARVGFRRRRHAHTGGPRRRFLGYSRRQAVHHQGSTAGTYVIMASTDPSQGTKGISAFIVDRATPGLVIGKLEKKLGVRASDTAALHFDDMRVPKENLLGRVNEGFRDVLAVLAGARIGMAALAVGIAQGALDEALSYAKRAAVWQADPGVRSHSVDACRHGDRK